MKKLYLLLLFVRFSFINAFASGKVPGVIINLSNGEKVEFVLSDNPKMFFDGTTITITTANLNLSLTPNEVMKVSVGDVDDTSGIADAVSNSSTIETKDGFVRLSGFVSGEEIKVYYASGVQYSSYNVSSDGTLIMSTSSLSNGVSIIKSNKQSIKVSKK